MLRQIEYEAGSGFDWTLAFVAVDAFRGYLQLLLWPTGQTIFHALAPIVQPFDVRVIVSLALFGGLFALAWSLRRASSLLLFGLLWFVLFLVPSSALFVLGRGEALAEHRVYLASAGVFLVVASSVGVVLGGISREATALRWAILAAVGVVALQLGGRTLLRNAVWADPVTLWRESAQRAPEHWLPHLMLGETLRIRSGCAEAEPEYRMAIQFAPGETFAYTKLGGCLIDRRAFDEAEMVFVQLRQVAPTSAEGPTGLAIIAMAKGAPRVLAVVSPGSARAGSGRRAAAAAPGHPRGAARSRCSPQALSRDQGTCALHARQRGVHSAQRRSSRCRIHPVAHPRTLEPSNLRTFGPLSPEPEPRVPSPG